MIDETSPINTGEIAPDFTLSAHDGSQRTLSDYCHQCNVILYFMREFECRKCQRNILDILKIMKQFPDENLELMVIGGGTPDHARRLAESYHIDSPTFILADENRAVYQAYGLHKASTLIQRHATLILDKSQTVQYIRFATIPGGGFDEAEFQDVLSNIASIDV